MLNVFQLGLRSICFSFGLNNTEGYFSLSERSSSKYQPNASMHQTVLKWNSLRLYNFSSRKKKKYTALFQMNAMQ